MVGNYLCLTQDSKFSGKAPYRPICTGLAADRYADRPLSGAVAAGDFSPRAGRKDRGDAGANPNASAGGASPLHVAADNGSREIVSCLIRAGGDPNLCDDVNYCKSFCLCLKLICRLSISYYWIVNVTDFPC
ncbi:hypothetical protein BHE74_00027893 [Ensete ventricosum]|nr:hypothetical protein BHE74_00027893 [Ensete ventricosum]